MSSAGTGIHCDAAAKSREIMTGTYGGSLQGLDAQGEIRVILQKTLHRNDEQKVKQSRIITINCLLYDFLNI